MARTGEKLKGRPTTEMILGRPFGSSPEPVFQKPNQTEISASGGSVDAAKSRQLDPEMSRPFIKP